MVLKKTVILALEGQFEALAEAGGDVIAGEDHAAGAGVVFGGAAAENFGQSGDFAVLRETFIAGGDAEVDVQFIAGLEVVGGSLKTNAARADIGSHRGGVIGAQRTGPLEFQGQMNRQTPIIAAFLHLGGQIVSSYIFHKQRPTAATEVLNSHAPLDAPRSRYVYRQSQCQKHNAGRIFSFADITCF